MWILICSNEGSRYFQRGDNSENMSLTFRNLLPRNHQTNFKQAQHKAFFDYGSFSFNCSNEVSQPQREVRAKITINKLTFSSRSIGPNSLKLGIKNLLHAHLQGGDINKIAKMSYQHFETFFSRSTWSILIKLTAKNPKVVGIKVY